MAEQSEFDGDFEAATRLEPLGELRFGARVPDGWQQGRGAFGGLVLGLLARAMESAEPDAERPLRNLSGEIVAPVLPGAAELSVEVLRRGSGISSVAARLRQEGELRALASGLFAKARLADREHVGLPRPAELTSRPWGEVEVAPVEPPFGPPFARAFEFRPTGPLPFSGGTEPLASGWIRLKRAPARLGAAELLAYCDAWWPTGFATESGPRPMATVAFTLQLLVEPGVLAPGEPLYHRARGLASHAGYAPELRELWTKEGRLVALNPQTFAIIR